MPAKVLIVDDNVYLNLFLRRALEDEGYEVEAARYGREGYSAYLRNRPDLILTDIHMPGESGLEMIQRIRRYDPEVRAIYMSGDWTRLQAAMEEEKSGPCVRSLRKPFRLKELLAVLSECFSPEEQGLRRLMDPPLGVEKHLSPIAG